MQNTDIGRGGCRISVLRRRDTGRISGGVSLPNEGRYGKGVVPAVQKNSEFFPEDGAF